MLGEKVGELSGQTAGIRILPGDDYRYVKMEVSIQQQGTIFGIQASDMGTFTAFERSGGQLYAQGQGIIMTAEGEAIWNGHGVGRPTGEGMGISIRFSIAFQAGEGALSRLNGVLVVGEYEQDADGKIQTSLWEWK